MEKKSENLDNEILELCRKGKKLEAIKLYKDTKNMTLRQSKDYVERLATDKGIKMPTGKHACFIATACYGDYDSFEVLLLRNYRDEILLPTKEGRFFVKLYYLISPKIAQILEKFPVLKNFTRNHILSVIVSRLQSKKFD